ncbi:transcriptional regulator [Vibrio ishigakensis]|uniref:Transcriptional regulator n=1 Tax=Vibrio ishigakensis TaxID=1481914 RepID=A0A0B8PDR2_9VIBR|nr:transcriptional regulator [Vibrio ishigakensis]
MSKIEQNREKKRRAILDSAKKIFLSKGYSSAGMDEIADESKLTKQTLYRYYSSKLELFQATLSQLGESYNDRYLSHLSNKDASEALRGFANEFVKFHLSEEHVATHRLLINEAIQAPEIVESFMGIGPDETSAVLCEFLIERFEQKSPEVLVELWLGMLLAPRDKALLGLGKTTTKQMEKHASAATDFLLANLKE